MSVGQIMATVFAAFVVVFSLVLLRDFIVAHRWHRRQMKRYEDIIEAMNTTIESRKDHAD